MDVSPVRPRSLARMTHLARRIAAACHQDRADGLAAALAMAAALVGLARAWAVVERRAAPRPRTRNRNRGRAVRIDWAE
jgi:protein subunit release factor B